MAGKLVQVATNTISSATASVTLTGINSDEVYMATINNATFSNDRVVYYRLTESGTANSTANYDRAGKLLYAGKAFVNNSGTNATVGYVDASRMESSGGINAILYIYNANNSSEYTYLTNETVGQLQTSQTGGYTGNQGGGVFTVASAVDGIQFLLESSDTFVSGTFTLYKVI